MSDLIVTQSDINESPFNSIRNEDNDGEFWLGRELMPLLGYSRWNEFEDVIERAKAACFNTGNSILQHFSGLTLKTKGRPQQEYRLSRYACYLTAQNGDPRKSEVASAQSYFALKTREAEIIIPTMDIELEKLKLQNENLKLQIHADGLNSTALAMHGETWLVIKGLAPAIIEHTVTEILEPETNKHTRILTADQLKSIVKQRTGQKLQSLKWFADELRSLGRDDLLIPVTRHNTYEYPLPNRIEEAISLVYSKNRQKLICE